MPQFDYAAPQTLKEAVDLLEQARGRALPLAGGTDLIPQIRKAAKQPALLVDIKRIPQMSRLEFVPGKGLHLGAAVTCGSIMRHPQVRDMYPALGQACSQIGSRQVRNRASVGGNVCNGAPSGDSLPPLLVFEATAGITGVSGTRQTTLEELVVGPGRTTLGPSELLVEIVVPLPAAHSTSEYCRLSLREEMDIALVGVAVLLAVEPDTGRCLEARIALGAVAPTPIRVRDAETVLQGRKITERLLDRAADLAAGAATPITDIRASAEYRREMVKVLTRRGLKACLSRLTRQGGGRR
ncbi:MAG: xanthine dehydrogenase family protein subunit M [Dehalococcoidia bacterium]